MYKLIRFYNQNKKKVWTIILIIVFVLGGIQLLNFWAKTNSNINLKQVDNILNNNNNSYESLTSDKSAISGQSVSSKKLKTDTDIINEFVNYCNEVDIESAYNLLTDECKEVMFPNIENFTNIYYNNVFNTYRTISIQNWSGNIYKVKFSSKVSSVEDLDYTDTKQDYITVIENNGEIKLNVNSYIERRKIDKEVEVGNIVVKIENIDIYMDSTVCTFDVKNNSYRTILLDSFSNIESMYIEDSKGVQYPAYTHEISQESLNFGISQRKKINIKYYSRYSSSKDMNKIVFSNVISDYERYNSLKDKTKYGKYLNIEIEI